MAPAAGHMWELIALRTVPFPHPLQRLLRIRLQRAARAPRRTRPATPMVQRVPVRLVCATASRLLEGPTLGSTTAAAGSLVGQRQPLALSQVQCPHPRRRRPPLRTMATTRPKRATIALAQWWHLETVALQASPAVLTQECRSAVAAFL